MCWLVLCVRVFVRSSVLTIILSVLVTQLPTCALPSLLQVYHAWKTKNANKGDGNKGKGRAPPALHGAAESRAPAPKPCVYHPSCVTA